MPKKGQHMHMYSEQEKADIRRMWQEFEAQGKSQSALSKELGVANSTLSYILGHDKRNPVPYLVPVEPKPTNGNLSLDQFMNMLIELVSEFKQLKERETHYKQMMNKWQVQAGILQENIQKLAMREN